MPESEYFIAPARDHSGPFGAKAAAEIPTAGVAPAVFHAIFNAVGVCLYQIPATPEWGSQALDQKDSYRAPDE